MRLSLVQQVEFSRTIDQKTVNKLVWVELSWGLKEGNRVRFFDEEKGSPLWRVVKVYKAVCEIESIQRKWGLNLPKSQRTER